MGRRGSVVLRLVLNDHSPSQHNYKENRDFSKIFFFFIVDNLVHTRKKSYQKQLKDTIFQEKQLLSIAQKCEVKKQHVHYGQCTLTPQYRFINPFHANVRFPNPPKTSENQKT